MLYLYFVLLPRHSVSSKKPQNVRSLTLQSEIGREGDQCCRYNSQTVHLKDFIRDSSLALLALSEICFSQPSSERKKEHLLLLLGLLNVRFKIVSVISNLLSHKASRPEVVLSRACAAIRQLIGQRPEEHAAT